MEGLETKAALECLQIFLTANLHIVVGSLDKLGLSLKLRLMPYKIRYCQAILQTSLILITLQLRILMRMEIAIWLMIGLTEKSIMKSKQMRIT